MPSQHIPARAPFFTLGLIVLIVAALALSRDYAVPIAVAVLIWFLINALADSVRDGLADRMELPRWMAQALGAVILFGLIITGINLLSGGLAELAQEAVAGKSSLLDRLELLFAQSSLPRLISIDQIIERIAFEEWIGSGLDAARGLISDVSIVFLYVLFLLIDERFYDAKLRAMFPNPARHTVVTSNLARIGETTRVYLWLMSLVSAGVGVVTFIVCLGVGLKGAGVWAILAFLLNFVPTLGSILAVLLPVAYGLATMSDPLLILVLIGALTATQFVAGEIVVPRLMGNRLNLSSFVILFALIIWGAMWGPVGMFLAIPITVIMVLVFSQFPATRPISIALSKDGRIPPLRRDEAGASQAAE